MARVVARGEKQKQILRLRASRYAQDGSHGGQNAQDDIREALGEAFLLNDRVNQLLLENLDAEAWRAKPPGNERGQGVRTIAAIFSHMHNIRRKWLRLSAPQDWPSRRTRFAQGLARAGDAFELPPELDRLRCTQRQVAKALKESAQLCAEMIADTRVTQFVRDDWARPWRLAPSATLRAGSQADALRAKTKTPGAAEMLAYMVSHEAHHRGQVCMLAHQMGYRLPTKVTAKMWAWEGLAISDQRSAVRKGKGNSD